jgi:hypothetical protein
LLALLRSAPHQATFNPPPVIAIESGVHAPAIATAAPRLPAFTNASATAPILAPPTVVRAPKAIVASAAAVPRLKFAARLELPVAAPALPSVPPAPVELRPNAGRVKSVAAPKLALAAASGGIPVPSSRTVLPANASSISSLVTAGGATKDTGQLAALVIGPNPGVALGRPSGAAGGTSVMSPRGGSQPGAGGTGGVAGGGRGTGIGIGTVGDGTGGGSRGTGVGADPLREGIAPGAGPGGAGSGNAAGTVPGVSISGNVVEVPSFGAGPGEPARPRRGPADQSAAPAVVVVGTSRAGGGLPEYGVLRGGRVYTTYIDTPRGSVVLQYADPAASSQDFDLTAPQAVTTSLPAEVKSLRAVISCVLDRTGAVTNVRVLKAAAPQIADAVARSLRGWRFHPALRGDQAVAVQAILGFGVSTNN